MALAEAGLTPWEGFTGRPKPGQTWQRADAPHLAVLLRPATRLGDWEALWLTGASAGLTTVAWVGSQLWRRVA